jgi:diguanylate cyclase (GGDEF)-like protein
MALGKINIDESLFEPEQKALQIAMADVANERYCGNELLPRYKSLVNHYRKLLKITKKVFLISDSQGQILQRHQNEIQNLLDNANQGFLTFDRNLKVDRQYSAECIKIFGRKIAGLPITQLLGHESHVAEETLQEILDSVFTCRRGFEQEALRRFPPTFRIGDKDIRVECKLISQADEGVERTLVMMILTDITERLRAEEQIRFLSYHDKLTSLHNRAHIEAVLPDLEKPEALPLSIIMVDMNGLKLVNDVFGHQQGDLLLVAMAEVLRKSCRQTDVIARWGGDEFLILLPQTDKNACLHVCEQIRAACSEVEDCAIPLSAAIGMASIDSGVARLMEMFNVAENNMYNDKVKKSREVRESIVSSLENELENRCYEDYGHGERVRQLAVKFVEYLGREIDSAEMKPLIRLAALHDMGKVAISREILGKPGTLAPGEREIIESHSEIGYRMAQSIGEPAVAEIILALHERWDGKGYPSGLKGEEIPLLARIFSLVDVYDVLIHDRPYKAAMDKKAALQEIEAGMGSQFDPELAKRFIEFMTKTSKRLD